SLGSPSPDNSAAAGLGYLSPELIRDANAEPRFYTDIYGLGLILYELLTGRPAFAGATARETLEQVRSQDPVSPTRLNSRVTPELEGFCLKCLGKNPWRRYDRAYDVQTRLGYFQEALDSQGGTSKRRRPLG